MANTAIIALPFCTTFSINKSNIATNGKRIGLQINNLISQSLLLSGPITSSIS